MSLDVGFKAAQVNSAVIKISIIVLIFPLDLVRGLFMLPLWPGTFFQLFEASHIWGEMLRLSGAPQMRLEAAVALVRCSLLDAYHGFGFTYQRNLQYIHRILMIFLLCFLLKRKSVTGMVSLYHKM